MNILRFFKENSLCIGRDIFRTQLNAVSRFYNALLNKQFAQNLQKVEQILVENKESLEAVVKEAIKRGNESNLGGKTEICTYLKARVIGDRTAVITHLLPIEDVLKKGVMEFFPTKIKRKKILIGYNGDIHSHTDHGSSEFSYRDLKSIEDSPLGLLIWKMYEQEWHISAITKNSFFIYDGNSFNKKYDVDIEDTKHSSLGNCKKVTYINPNSRYVGLLYFTSPLWNIKERIAPYFFKDSKPFKLKYPIDYSNPVFE